MPKKMGDSTMLTVSIKNKHAEILTALGGLQQAIDLALQRYIIEQVTAKVAEFYQKEMMYQTKYGMDYLTFTKRIAEDEEFINQVEANVNKIWEFDLADWEFCYQGRQDWIQKLQTILLT
jgi:hypothetical protein